MSGPVARRAAAEAIGTAFLTAAVIGSGIAAQQLAPDAAGLQLLINSVVTGAVLVALILALQPVSAAFNPLVTLMERAYGQLRTPDAVALIGAQLAGAAAGAMAANLMFDRAAITLSQHERDGAGLWLAEVIATVGLLLVIFGAARTGRADRVAYAVGGYITGAYWFTSSTSFANPALTAARTLSDTFAGIAPASVPVFLLAQAAGALLAYPLIRLLFPTQDHTAPLVPATEGTP